MLQFNNKFSVAFLQEVGTRQGNPLSPILFTIGIEGLLRRIDQELDGIVVNNKTVAPSRIKYSAFADDIAVHLEYPRDYHALKGILEDFGNASNSKINTD